MNRYPPGLPCWAPGAADHLASMLKGQEVAIEWGGGQSTAWLAPRVLMLHTMEHDAEWVRRIAEATDEFSNVVIHHEPFSDPLYVNVLANMDRSPQPHVWLIDGFQRIKCLDYVFERAQAGDIVVCDDALDYLPPGKVIHSRDLKRFAMPHPYAGTKINQAQHAGHGNTLRTHHAMTKETWIWRV